VKTPKELIALAKARPGQLNYVTPGVGSLTHLATELLINMSKISMVGIGYKSTGAALPDLLSGQLQLIVGSLLPTLPHIQSGKLRALAVTTAKRWYSLPDIPPLNETLPGYEVELWFGVMAPRGTPPAVIDRLNAAVNRFLQDPDMKKNLEAQGMVASGGTPQRFGERIRKDYERWVKVVREQNIKPD
jgi:tripartite-type tricarboxylate transporter receptor subunit TctC